MDDLEARISALEAHVANLRQNSYALMEDTRVSRERLINIEAKLGRPPSRTFLIMIMAVVLVVTGCVVLFQDQIRAILAIPPA